VTNQSEVRSQVPILYSKLAFRYIKALFTSCEHVQVER
jgi:hypothetical protein